MCELVELVRQEDASFWFLKNMLGVTKMDNVQLVDVTCWVRMLVQKFGLASTVNSHP